MIRAMAAAAKRVPIPKNGVDYRGKVVLAPMVRSGECPSRLLALKYGADLVWGPETIDQALIGTTRVENPVTKTIDFTRKSSNGTKNAALQGDDVKDSVIFRLHPEKEGKKLIYQIGTANPDRAVQAASLIAADVAGIDVNAGCPKPFSTSGGMGAALLKTPDKLCSILRALIEHVGRPFEIGISVKIRLLETPEQTESLVRQLCATGITGLTIHCRTTPMRPRERAIRDQLNMIREVCHEHGVACLVNGDVYGRDHAMELVKEYGVDGAMIATAAETNPSVFRAESDGGKATWEQVVKEYVELCMEVENRWGNTKYLLGQMIPGKADLYQKMTRTSSYVELVETFGYTDLAEMANETDRRLELGTFSKPKLSKAARKAANKAANKAAQQQSRKSATDSAKENELPPPSGIKRSADIAELGTPEDVLRDRAPGTLSENASALVV